MAYAALRTSRTAMLSAILLLLLCGAVPTRVEANFLSRWWKWVAPRSSFRAIVRQLRAARDPEEAIALERTSPGKKFLGIGSRSLRRIMKDIQKEDKFSVSDAWALLDTPYNEQRWVAIRLLAHRFGEAGEVLKEPAAPLSEERSAAEKLRSDIVKEFVRRIPSQIDNWNLVDAGALPILGEHAVTSDEGHDLLYDLASSTVGLRRRAAVRATEALLEKKKFEDFETISAAMFGDPDQLVREAAAAVLQKADKDFLVAYVNKYRKEFPSSLLTRVVGIGKFNAYKVVKPKPRKKSEDKEPGTETSGGSSPKA